jgi:hypothetical protein
MILMMTFDKVNLDNFIGFQGQFSALVERSRQQVRKLQRSQRTVTLETSTHDNNQVISEVTVVPALSGRRHTQVTRCFNPT